MSARIILASASPQRRKILQDAGYTFECVDPGEVENAIASAPTPDALAIAKARSKSMEVASRLEPPFPAVVVGVDTLVALKDDVIGKPLDRFDAKGILSRLSGSRHQVISGISLWPVVTKADPGTVPVGEPKLAAASTWVTMRAMSEEEIDAYIETGQSDGKAGAYAIQESGDKFVSALEGSFLNVVGFPLELFKELLPQCIQEWRF